MASPLDYAAIRSLTLAETAAYFAQCIQQLGWSAAWDSLRDGIRDGLLPATLVHIFLAQCRHPQPLVEAMRQHWSALARKTAIKHFARWTKHHDTLAPVWAAVGDTPGLLDLMAALSVADVDLLCRAINLNSRNSADQDARRRNMTGLYNALTGHPDARFPNPDRRPLSHLYHQIVPSCTSDVVLRATTKKTTPNRATVKAHLPAFQRACLDAIFADPLPTEKLSVWAYVLEIDVDFAFTVLEKLVQSPVHLQHNASCVIWILVQPLAMRLANRREHAPVHARLYDLLFKCLAIEPSVALIRMDYLITTAVKAWKVNRGRSDLLDSYLGRLIAIAPATSLTTPGNTKLLEKVPQQARFPLLKILLRHSPTLQIDLDLYMSGDGTSQNKQAAAKLQWSHHLFHLLPHLEATQLFEMIQGGSVPVSFQVDTRSLVPQDPGGDRGAFDMEYFKASLYARTDCPGADNESWRDETSRVIGYRKTRAATAREPADREKWAQAAIALSVATGSIETYATTLHWARRFHKDPVVGPRLMTFDNMATVLLSGLPEWSCFESSNGAAAISEAVLRGNEVVIHVLETAAMLSHEPSFQTYVVFSALELPGNVVRRRLARIENLLSRRLVTHEWSVTHIWTPTIKMLVDAERFLLAEGHQVLGHNHIEGLLDEAFDCSSRHAQWFLDNLAKQRDELWCEHRARLRPATTALPTPWPRGLPVADLFPLEFDEKRPVVLDMPYFQARVRAVVFASQASVLMAPPEDEEDKEAIGPFVDSYSFALKVFVKFSARFEQERRVAEAWAHATTVLTGDRMSSSEAIPFWKDIFYKAGIPSKLLPILPDKYSCVMALPTTTTPSFPVEWNPEPTPRPSRELPTKALDCMLHATCRTGRASGNNKPTMDSTFFTPKSRTIETPMLWSDRYLLLLPVAERDAFAVAAICLLNAQFGAHPSRFLKTYPSESAMRIPPVYLDEDFLEKESKHMAKYLGAHTHILTVIAHLSSSIPNDLLVDLARSIFARMENDEREGKEDPRVREAALFIVRRISYGEQPVTACEFVRRVVLERQEDSSWHRQVLDRAFLKNLPAEEARVFFGDLALAIQKKLQQQRLVMEQKKAATAATVGEKTETTSTTEETQSKPLVKITTIKMIAQLQRWASFAEHEFALEILTGLLRNSSHPDVVICIVEGLIQQRLESSDESMKSKIVETIAEHIVPLAASLDERSPLTEEAWVKLERGEGRIPEMYSADDEDLSPLMSLFWDAARYPTNQEVSAERHTWMERIVIPTLRLSAANHMRWTRLFLQRNSLPVSVADILPAVPPKISMILEFLESYTAYMPVETTATLQRFISVIGFPLLALRGVFRQIQNDKALRETPGGKHFLKTWCSEEMTKLNAGDYKAMKTLVQFLDKLDIDDAETLRIGHTAGLTIPGLQRFLIRLSKKHIWNGNLKHLERILIRTPLDTVPASRSAADAQAARRRWEHNIRPVLAAQLAAVEALEADDEWRRAHPARKLPDTRPYRLEMLTHTHARHADEDEDDGVGPAAITACADALLAELGRCITEGHLHDDGGAVQSLVETAQVVYGRAKHGFMLALRLGALGGAEDGDGRGDALSVMRQNMRVYLARILLERHFQREPNEQTSLTEQVFDMVAVSWLSEQSGGYVREQAEALLDTAKRRRWIITDKGPRWLIEALDDKGKELVEMRSKDREEDGEMDWILDGDEDNDDGLVLR
ncbi:hypothetical protein MN608_07568 [Microdochium nivale]|nr:hypothetical protein MN608_07568 [Microdochium nivale]